jgi:selenide,water dikinase
MVHPDRILTKGGARPDDAIFLSKPLGTGVMTTAAMKDRVEADHLRSAVESMSRLNRRATEIVLRFDDDLHAATDVTGFGLVGHAHEMAHASGVTLRFEWDRLPLLDGAEAYARAALVPGGGKRNRLYYTAWTTTRRALEDWQQVLLHDPQTSGGLLFAVSGVRADDVERAFADEGEPVWRVGQAVEGAAGGIEIV